MGEIIRLLSEGFSKGKIIEMIDFKKGKTQSYVSIEKAQKNGAKNI